MDGSNWCNSHIVIVKILAFWGAFSASSSMCDMSPLSAASVRQFFPGRPAARRAIIVKPNREVVHKNMR
jgi:hypothetical protein